MEKFVKTVTYSEFDNDICITLDYSDGCVKGGEIMIVDTIKHCIYKAFLV